MKRRNKNRGGSRPIPLAVQLLLSALLVAVLTLFVLRASNEIERMDPPAIEPAETVMPASDTTAS